MRALRDDSPRTVCQEPLLPPREARFRDEVLRPVGQDGILIIAGWNLVLVKEGQTRVITRRVYGLRISGDGSKIITKRYRRASGEFSTWISNPDGSEQRRIGEPFSSDETYHSDVIPNHDASALLSYRSTTSSDDSVTWSTDEHPDSAVVFDLINNGGYPATWN